MRGNTPLGTLRNLRGNTRLCVLTEPMFGIPHYLYLPYVSLYMSELGVSDARIGMIVSVGLLFQVLATFFGGAFADKYGRRRTTFVADTLSWSIPTLLWTFARNEWWFFAAAAANATCVVADNGWNCLLVEDCPKRELVDVYTLVSMAGLLSVFFAPLAGVFVRRYTVVPTMRVLYFIAFVFMTAKFILLYARGTETSVGRARMREMGGTPLFAHLGRYPAVFKKLVRSRGAMLALMIRILLSVTNMVAANFFALYAVGSLGVPAEYMSYFPMVRAAIALFFMLFLQRSMARMPLRPIMAAGAALYIGATAALLLAGRAGGLLLAVYVVCDAVGFSIFVPRSDSIYTLFIDREERAVMTSLTGVIMLAASAPFGAIAGALSEIDRRAPFVLSLALYALCLLLVLASRALREQDRALAAMAADTAPR